MRSAAPMYFVPHPEDVARAQASTCHLATPKDPRDCQGEACFMYDYERGRPCIGYRSDATGSPAAGD